MHINRQTYEEFFLLYTDGELSSEEKKAVEDFVKQNPDLEPELKMLQASVFEPEESIVFEDKQVLYRHETKVAAFPWFRVAAAAVVVMVLTTVGWIYISNSDEAPPPVVASKDLVREETTQKPVSPARVEPSVTTGSQPIESPAEKIHPRPVAKSSVAIKLLNVQAGNNDDDNKKNNSRDDSYVSNTLLDASKPNHEVVAIDDSKEVIDVPVAPRDIEQHAALAAVQPETRVEYVEAQEDNMIYFANTSLPKKSKLRGVFRKATRFLDKVTSLQ